MSEKIFLLLPLFFFLLPESAFSQLNLPILEKFGPEVGFRQREVFDILKSAKGYIWVGTNNGLARFDGHSFIFYNSVAGTGNSISGDYVTSLCEDDQGRIWMIASDMVNVLDTRSNTFYKPELISNKGVVSGYEAYSIIFDKKNNKILINTTAGFFSNSGKLLKPLKLVLDKRIPFEGKLSVDKYNNICIAGNSGIYRLDEKYRLKEIINQKNKKGNSTDGFISFYEDDESVFAGTYFDGLYIRNKKAERSVYFNERGLNAVFSIQQHPEIAKFLLLGTSSGLHFLDKTTLKTGKINMDFFTSKDGFQGNVYCVRLIGKREIWLGCSKGLAMYDLKRNIFRNLKLNFIQKKDAEVTDVQFEETDKADSIAWIFSRYNGIFKYDMIGGKSIKLPDAVLKFADENASDFRITGNELWICSYKEGLIGFDLKKNKVLFKSDPGFKKPFLQLNFDKAHKLWLTSFDGLYYLDRRNSEIVKHDLMSDWHSKNGFNPYVLDIETDAQNKLWMLFINKNNKKELVIYDQQTGKVFVKPPINCNIFNDLNKIEGIYIGQNDVAYLYGTKCLVRTSTKNFLTDTSGSNCQHINENIFSFQETSEGFWLSTLGGVFHGNRQGFKIISEYNYYNSNISIPHIAPFIKYSGATNKLYIFSNNEVSVINETELDEMPSPAPQLTNVFINNIKTDNIDSLLVFFELPYDRNTLSFEFSNFSFTNTHLNTYFYRITDQVNKNPKWIKASHNNIDFLNLKPGKYKLEVSSVNFLGIPSGSNCIITFKIKPPFWNTWWFYCLAFLFTGGGFYILYLYRIQQIRKLENIRLNIARDLHDDIGSHLSQIKMISEIEAGKSDNSNAFRSIHNALTVAMSNLAEIVWSINPKNSQIDDVISRIQEFAIETLEPLDINIHFNIDKEVSGFNYDFAERRHLFLIFKEAITNIAKYSSAKNVELITIKNKSSIVISIKDDGNGFDPFLIRKGNGLKNMRSRAEILKGQLEIHTSASGTEVTIKLKI